MRLTPLLLLALGVLFLLAAASSFAPGHKDALAAASDYAAPRASSGSSSASSLASSSSAAGVRAEIVDTSNIFTRSFFASLLLGDPFSGLGLLDLLIVGVAIYLLIRFTRGSAAPETDAATQPNQDAQPGERRFGPGPETEAYKRAAQNWDHLRTRPKAESQAQAGKSPQAAPRPGPAAPPPAPARTAEAPASEAKPSASETEDEFLQGAKMVYCRIYSSLASADLADVKHFTSAIMFEELKPLSGRRLGQILLVEAKTLDRKTTAGIAQVRVAFEVLLQKEEASQPEETREIWRFHRDAGNPDSTWRLAAIER